VGLRSLDEEEAVMRVDRSKSRRLARVFLVGGTLSLLVFTTTSGAATPSPNVPGSKLVPAINVAKNGKGVTASSIKIVFNFALKGCGADPATVGTRLDQPAQQDVATTLAKWFNDNFTFPGGRKLDVQVVNSGEPNVGCASVARAAGLDVAKSMNAFAAIGNSSNQDGNAVFASTVTANGTIDIAQAGSFQLSKDFTNRWPYAWQVPPPADEGMLELTWFIGKRVKGTSYVGNDGSKSARKWGTIFFDSSVGHALSTTTINGLKAQGISAKAYFISSDPAQQAQQATSLAAQIKSDGINSMVYGVNDAPADIALAKAFNSQNFFPDHYVSDESVAFKLAVFANILFPTQIKRMHGVGLPDVTATRIDINPNGTNGVSATLQANDWRTASIAAYKAAGGKRPDPQNGADLEGIWQALSTLTIGIVNAGKTLNAFTFAHGLAKANACQLQRSFGAYQPQTPLPKLSDSRHQPWVLHGFTSYYWTTARPSTYGAATNGYWESYDGYLRYFTQKGLPAKPVYDTGEHNGQYPLNPQREGKITSTMKCSVPK
jgi:hypothetical protein